MAQSLIATLSQFQHLTPDEIVKKLSSRGWIRPRDMTQEYWDANKGIPHIWWLVERGRLSTRCQSRSWTPYSSYSSLRGFKLYLDADGAIYWMIPTDQFDESNPPPCETN